MTGDITPFVHALFWSGVIVCACWFAVQWLEAVRSFRRGEHLTARGAREADAGGAEPPLGDRPTV